jgi:DNA-binding Xre family transcriptional regulator
MSSLSRTSDVSFLTVKRIWREPFRGVNTTTLERLAKALDVSVAELFEEVPNE